MAREHDSENAEAPRSERAELAKEVKEIMLVQDMHNVRCLIRKPDADCLAFAQSFPATN